MMEGTVWGGNHQNSLVHAMILFVFIVLGIAAENNPLYLIFDVHFTFTAVFYFIVFRLFGYRKALIAVSIIYLTCYFMGSFHGTRFIFALLEISFVVAFLRWKGKELLWWDLLFWFIAGPIACYFTTHHLLDEFIFTWLALLTYLVNALICVIIAEVVSTVIPLLPIGSRFFVKKKALFFW
ncbi:hypothetical protein [Marinicrinis lubricantis]|uniref:Uncharacterized protein n=1 Tax=Marinicrinis lubricantis TaxID=2086470 RepID=A0ABW1IN41_9BACL